MGKGYYGIATCDQCGEEIERVDLWDTHGTHLAYPKDWWPEDVCGAEECVEAVRTREKAEVDARAELMASKTLVPHSVKCEHCEQTFKTIYADSDYAKWESGEPIQDVMDYLSPSDRELIISNTCGKCFDEFFPNP
jgi:hypothetical protein